MTTATALSPRLRVGYASGGIATGAFGTVPGLLLLPYLTDSLGISALVAGLIVFLPKAWDVVLNPITGRVSDRFATRRGTRRPFLLWGGIGLAVGFVLLFSGPLAPPVLAGGWVVVAFLLCATAYSVFQVPYVALPAELTADYDERTRLLTWRVAILAVAILLSGATAPLIRNALGYPAMAVFVGVLILLGALGAYAGTRGVPAVTVPAPPGGLLAQLSAAARVADFRRLLITFGVQALAIGCLLAGVDYVARVVLERPGASSVLFACFVGPALLVTPVWQRLAGRLGKKSGYRAASLVLVVGCAGLALAGSAPLPVVYAHGRGDRDRLRRSPAVPAGHAARHRRARRPGDRREPGRRVHRGVDGGGDPGPGPGAGGVRRRAGPRRLPLLDRRRGGPAGVGPDRDRRRLLGRPGGPGGAQPDRSPGIPADQRRGGVRWTLIRSGRR